MFRKLFFLCFVAIIFLYVIDFVTQPIFSQAAKKIPAIRIVYFIPSDQEAIPDRTERLGRVMKLIQDFYRTGMRENGYSDKIFSLEWESPNKLKLYTIHGQKRQQDYGRNDAGEIRKEVRDGLKLKYGIEANDEVLVIFQLLLKWDGNKATELGPFVGSGSHLNGTAWVYEDKRLDPLFLTSKESGGYYYGHCTLGQFNTHYLGGIAHELGHAFSLPHECELEQERMTKGTSLMGNGNHTFGQEQRGEGLGTFLSAASALRLSVIRAFVGDLPASHEPAYWNIEELNAEEKSTENSVRENSVTKNNIETKKERAKSFILSGRVTASPQLAGIIVYNDNKKIAADYDAKTWTTRPDSNGSFRLEIGELKNVPYQFRLVGIHENGATNQLSINYEVYEDRIDLSAINFAIPIDKLKRLFNVGNIDELKAVSQQFPQNEEMQRKANHLISLLKTMKTIDVTKLPESVRETDISFAEFIEAKTGWGNFRRAHVPEDVFLQIGGQFFESGLYAHAPSVYKINLDEKWKTLEIGFGLQDDHDGTVLFVIQGDGTELFRSEQISEHQEYRKTVSVDKIKILELLVLPSQNGNSGAWGVWTNPTLKR